MMADRKAKVKIEAPLEIRSGLLGLVKSWRRGSLALNTQPVKKGKGKFSLTLGTYLFIIYAIGL